MSKKLNKSTTHDTPLEDRDFIQEYNELLEKFGYNIRYIEQQLQESSGRIKKFSLLETSPTPTLSDNTL